MQSNMFGKGRVMEENEVEVRFAEHRKDIRSLENRMDKQEAQNEVIQDLVISVKEMAINMTQMLEELKAQGARLDKLEREPAESWKLVKTTLLTALISVLIGAVVGHLI